MSRSSDYLLVTGASGFVGEQLVGALAGSHGPVVGTHLSSPAFIDPAISMLLDITDSKAVHRLIRDMRPRAIVHCAAATQVGWCEQHPDEAENINLEGTRNFCKALKQLAPETPFLFFSTDMVFDGEKAPYSPDDEGKPLSVYGSLKWAAEQEVIELDQGIVLRSALVYGPPSKNSQSFLSWMIEMLRQKQELTLFEDEWRTPVFVGDLISAVKVLLDQWPHARDQKIFHAGGPQRLNRVEMGHAVCQAFSLSPEAIRVCKREDIAGAQQRPCDVSLDSSALTSLSWEQTSFLDGLLKCQELWPN